MNYLPSLRLILPLIVVAGALLLLPLIGIIVSIIMPGIERQSRVHFFTFFLTLMLGVCSILIDSYAYTNPKLVMLEKLSVYCEYLFLSALLLMLTVQLLYYCGENWRESSLFRVAFALWCLFFVLLGIGQFTTAFYYITSETLIYRGPWHPLMMSPLDAIMIINLIILISRRGKMSRKNFYAFLITLIPLTVAIIVHTFVYAILLLEYSIVLWAVINFIIILSEQIDQYMRQQREIAHQRANIMVLQMRPHFIYNTMTSIYYLCEQDPKKAQQVTLDFTTYLRRNFNAIASEEMISFSDELEHTRAYLAVEQAQFEDRLFVEYDTPHTQFFIPPLTLQPIVENAVKHGMDPDSESFHIFIRTRKTDSGSEIIVEDDGCGFDPADNSGSHSALTNIRQRLKMMCHGKMTIVPREGGGTVVRVSIP